MPSETSPLVVIVGALVAALPGVLAFFRQWRTDRSQFEAAAQAAVLSLVTPLKERVTELEREAAVSRDAQDALHDQIATLRSALREKTGELALLHEQLKKSGDQVTSLVQEVSILKDELTQKDEMIIGLTRELKAALRARDERTTHLRTIEQRLSEIESKTKEE